MNIFIFHRDLRLTDNTTLIYQLKEQKNVIPIFIFPPEQIDPVKNTYFSNNSVQFMIESLHELANAVKEYNGKMYFFKGSIMSILNEIHKEINIDSIGFNIDYTPYARKRDDDINSWCLKNNIICYKKEDYLMHNITDEECIKKKVFTPFKNFCFKNLIVSKPDKFNKFSLNKNNKLKLIKFHINIKLINDFYKENVNINVHGGRSSGLKILKSLDKFKSYEKDRNTCTYDTTFLGAHNHFSTVSIREVYNKMLKKLGPIHSVGLINELYWREFYVNITWHFPYILYGQLGSTVDYFNKSFKPKYDDIIWDENQVFFNKWCSGKTGFPIVDAGMRQMNTIGFMHNRLRMITATFLTKDLHLDWKLGEQYFATKLVDYSVMQNNGGWQWCSSTGTDSQPYFRIFNPWTQTVNFDPHLEYVKKWIPELNDVPNKDIINWIKPEIHKKWLKNNIKYYEPMVIHDIERKITLETYKNI